MRSNKRGRSLPREPQVFEIEKLSHEGRGLTRHEGQVVFVDGALPGETVRAEFTSRRGSYAEARTLEVLNPSAERTQPPCPHFAACGGCSLQHYASASQLAFKEAVLHERLAHAAGAGDYDKLPAIAGADRAYRRKARLAVRYVAKKERVLVGFREQHSNFITDMDSCAVLEPEVAQLLPLLPELIGRMHCREQLPQVEVAIGDAQPGSNTCALIFRHLQPLDRHDLDQLLAFGVAHAVDVYLQPKGPDSVHRVLPAGGDQRLFYGLTDFNLTLAFHPTDFTQVNAGINRMMVRRAVDLLDVQPTDRVLDLFCGLGNFTLPLATRAAEVIGVEGAAAMVERGTENAGRNGLTNVRFLQADLTLHPDQHAWLKQGFDKVLLDPPRSGALEVLPAVVAARPARIVYVSCNPATLARDAAYLAEHGYVLVAAGAMDMFPHTSHVEAMALFVPKGASGGKSRHGK
ncbi:MAG TPA: 23S rRNA (uracil(1939)-C(5))-methyltransferase RlmD [Pseudomonadales bacterium]